MKAINTTLLCFVISITNIAAQEVTQKEIESRYAYADDNMEYDYLDKAIPSLHWLLKNAPSFNKNVQRYAIEAFEKKAGEIEDENQKKLFLDSMLIAYESKKINFGLNDLDKNKLAFRYFKYFRDDKSKLTDAINAYEDVYKSPESVINNNLMTYMYMLQRYHNAAKPLNQEEIIEAYDAVSNVIDLKKASGKDVQKLDKYMAQVDDIFVRITSDIMNCDIIQKLSTGMNRSDSVKVSKRIMSLTLDSKCGRTVEFVRAMDLLSRNEPTPGIFKVLAQYEAAAKQYDEAISLYSKAFDLETDNEKKATIHFSIAQLHAVNRNKPEARKFARSVIKLDDSQAPVAYTFIGNLYLDSFNECSESDDDIENRAVYFAAYDMFEKANNTKMKEEISKQFPTTSNAFSDGHYVNDEIEVGCWMNVKTKVRTRPSN